jgi:hypothetical protein
MSSVWWKDIFGEEAVVGGEARPFGKTSKLVPKTLIEVHGSGTACFSIAVLPSGSGYEPKKRKSENSGKAYSNIETFILLRTYFEKSELTVVRLLSEAVLLAGVTFVLDTCVIECLQRSKSKAITLNPLKRLAQETVKKII